MIVPFLLRWRRVVMMPSTFILLTVAPTRSNAFIVSSYTSKTFMGTAPTQTTTTSLKAASTTITPSFDPTAAAEAKEDTTTTTTTTTTTDDTKTIILNNDEDFIKPDPDPRKYRAIQLPNGLKALLVSAPESDVEAASIHVKAGHMDDPVDRAGLAHFHEHMLFLGTEKYPGEEDYQDFLNQNGGSCNAYTDMEDTNYYFSVTTNQNEQQQLTSESESTMSNDENSNDDTSSSSTFPPTALHGGLDRLSQFFIAPTFDPSMVDRELRAIDSEYRNGLTSDAWRNSGVLKASCDPRHPFSKFGCGNYKTLTQGGRIVNSTNAEDIQSLPVNDLLQFWKDYYRTFNMRLCVVGRTSLDTLQQSVEETFGQVPKSEGEPRKRRTDPSKLFAMEHSQYDPDVAAFGKAQLGKLRHIQPLTESRHIHLLFGTPPLHDPLMKQCKPHRVLSHLIGHEAPGSLHAILNEDGLITGLTSGVGIDSSDFSLFSVTIRLTAKGMEQSDRVLSLFFQWLAKIRDTLVNGEETLMKAYHDELGSISEVDFRFRENGNPTSFCSAASKLLFSLEPSRILSGTSISPTYDAAVTQAFFDRLSPDNALIHIFNSDLDDERDGPWETERWYGAKYKVMDIDDEQVSAWKAPSGVDERLSLPELNKFVPTDFDLRAEKGDYSPAAPEDVNHLSPPKKLEERPGYRMWHKMDSTWRVPKALVRLALISPEPYRSPRTMTQNRIFEKVLSDDLNSYMYSASLAGCQYTVAVAPNGYRISIRGYSEKLPILLDAVTSRILTLIEEMKDGSDLSLQLKFQKAKETLLRQSKNYRINAPYKVCNYNARTLLEDNVWHVENYIAELEDDINPLTMKECAEITEQSLRGPIRAHALCFGNIDEEETKRVSSLISERMLAKSRPLQSVEMPVFRGIELPTEEESKRIFGNDFAGPLIYQEVASSESEENNALELTFQCGCEHTLGYEGVAMLTLLAHLGYNSAYSQLRTQEQLGYIVSAQSRKAAGKAWSFVVLVQSSVALPSVLEERIEAWIHQFRKQLQDTPEEEILSEANAVVAQLLGRITGLGEEASRGWGEIMNAAESDIDEPNFDRVEIVAKQLQNRSAEDIRSGLLNLLDTHLIGPERRVLSSRVYCQNSREEYDENENKLGVITNFEGVQKLNQFLSTYPLAPYWIQR